MSRWKGTDGHMLSSWVGTVLTSPVTRTVSCDGSCRVDELEGKSIALERWIHMRMKKSNNSILLTS